MFPRLFPLSLSISFMVLPLALRADDTLRLDIPKVMALAQAQSVEAIVADQRVLMTLARIDEARSTLYPQISATASQTRETRNLKTFGFPLPGNPRVGPINVFDARLRLSQTVFDKSAIERLRQARSLQALSEAERRKTRQDATVLALTLFVEARRAEESRTAAAAILERDVKALSLAEERFRNGSGTSLDAAELSVDVSVSRQRMASVETERAERRFDLLALLGLPLSTTIEFSSPTVPTAPQPLTSEVVDEALSRHTDIDVARLTVLSRRSDEAATRADYYPQIEGVADYGASGNEPNGSLSTYRYGGQLNLPILEGGRRKARTQAAIRSRTESDARYRDVRLRVEARARSAQVALEQTWALIQATDSDRQVAQKQVQLAESRLKNGLGSAYERLERRTTFIRTEDAWQEAVAAYELARIQKAAALDRLDTLKEGHP